MANTLDLSALTEVIYAARDQVAREQVGFLTSVNVNGGSEAVSLGGTVESLRTVQPQINSSYTPAMTIPAGDDIAPQKEEMTISQVANAKIPWTGESALKLNNTGRGRQTLQDTFARAIRGMVNQIESHVGVTVKNGSSRAVGTAGTTPFASNHNIINSLKQVLDDNGCAQGERSLVINSNAGVNLRNLTQLTKANEAGSSDPLRRGTLLDVSGFMIKESAGVAAHTKGTLGGSPTSAAAGFTLGATDILLTASVGTGSIVPGDVLSIANDTTNSYVVKTGVADASTAATLVLNRPGLRKATGASTRALSLAANYTANVAFHRTAVELVMRPPAMPDGGDAAADRMTLFDPDSGLTFEIALYKGYGMVLYDITCFYEAKVWNPEFVATLLG